MMYCISIEECKRGAVLCLSQGSNTAFPHLVPPRSWEHGGTSLEETSLEPVAQYFPVLGPQLFLDYNSQKFWPAQLVAKVSWNFSPRTSGNPKLRTIALAEGWAKCGPPDVVGLQFPSSLVGRSAWLDC